jgi:hypothetical protein
MAQQNQLSSAPSAAVVTSSSSNPPEVLTFDPTQQAAYDATWACLMNDNHRNEAEAANLYAPCIVSMIAPDVLRSMDVSTTTSSPNSSNSTSSSATFGNSRLTDVRSTSFLTTASGLQQPTHNSRGQQYAELLRQLERLDALAETTPTDEMTAQRLENLSLTQQLVRILTTTTINTKTTNTKSNDVVDMTVERQDDEVDDELRIGNPSQRPTFSTTPQPLTTDNTSETADTSASSSSLSHFLSQIASSATVPRRQVCQHPFKRNDIVWVCRTCQVDETCVLCHECFSQSHHEHHDVAFYHAQAGGCCDCGDADGMCVAFLLCCVRLCDCMYDVWCAERHVVLMGLWTHWLVCKY